VLSGLYIFTLKARQTISPGRLPKYPDPSKRDELFLSSARYTTRANRCLPRLLLAHDSRARFVHRNRHLGRYWQWQNILLHASVRGADSGYKAADKEKRIGGLILEVKAIFCRKVKDILSVTNGRGLHRNQPPIPSTATTLSTTTSTPTPSRTTSPRSLNNLFGRGKEPSGRQALHQPRQFIILLHKAAYDYVTSSCLPVRHLSAAARRTDR